jgi:hypothetical protein
MSNSEKVNIMKEKVIVLHIGLRVCSGCTFWGSDVIGGVLRWLLHWQLDLELPGLQPGRTVLTKTVTSVIGLLPFEVAQSRLL